METVKSIRYLSFTLLATLIISCGQVNNDSGKETEQKKTGIYGFLCIALPSDDKWYLTDSKAPLLEGMGDHTFRITTENDSVQKYFDQGLTLAYGFNHAEAARSFYTASRIDPECAMCYWGYAYVLGPNYNAGMEDDNYQRAYDAIRKASSLSGSCTEKEADLIAAMSTRYAPEPPDDRTSLDSNYSARLAEMVIKYPEDADIAAMYAESLMDMHPWDLWDKQGNPKEWTPAILDALDNVLNIDSRHPGGHHFYIHAVEASYEPEKGYPSAEVFDNGLVPGSGHLMHMPSHIYIRTGDYHKGSLANLRAVKVDSNYTTQCHAQGAYPLAYYPHNYHFMTATATMSGNSKLALDAADKTSGLAHNQIMKEPGWGTLQHFYSIPYFVMVKFAKWNRILEIPDEPVELVYPRCIRHYARGMSYAVMREFDKANYELKQLKELSEQDGIKDITIWDINDGYTLLQIAILVLEGEIAANQHDNATAAELFRQAVEIEDALNYDEPPDWFFSVRHHLGSALVNAGKGLEAIEVYKQDLKNLPENGWALHGLKEAYRQVGDNDNYESAHERFIRAWEHGDISLRYSNIY